MVVVLYSDQNYEYQVVSCLETIRKKINNNIKILYVSVGFESDIEFPNLMKYRMEINPIYPHFCFYKPEVCLIAMNIFPGENFIFTDTDTLFSPRFQPDKMIHSNPYPLASFGEYEYPYHWELVDGETMIYDEVKLSKYFGVGDRTQRYVLSCFFTFNEYCRDFMEEWYSMCTNTYLLDRRKIYFPFPDETAFNVCLWKRGATENLGFGFLNEWQPSVIKEIEEWFIQGGNLIEPNKQWSYLTDTSKLFFYHGMKDKNQLQEAWSYLQNIS